MLALFNFEKTEKPGFFKRLVCFLKKTNFINIKKLDFIDSFYIELNIEYFAGEQEKKILKKIKTALKQASDYDIGGFLLNKNSEFYGVLNDLELKVYNPYEFYKKNIIKILKFLSSRGSLEIKDSVCVLNDPKLENVDFDFLLKVSGVCRVIGLISKNSATAFDIIDDIYDKSGIPVIFMEDLNLLRKAHYIISFNDTLKLLENLVNQNAYLIAPDALSLATPVYNIKLVTGYEFKLKKCVEVVPEFISQMEFFGAISEYYNTDLFLKSDFLNIINQ